MTIRDEKNSKRDNTLLDAALKLMSDGRSFVSISLREVTREAGVVPTAFYRHFRDMDELGLALVDDVSFELTPFITRRTHESARRRTYCYSQLGNDVFVICTSRVALF
jgi:AcrR family transcriptional regulator